MAKAILENLDGLSDDLKAEYTEKDGKFFLNVETVDGYELADVGGLKGTLSKEMSNRKGLEKKLERFEKIKDPEKVAEALAELEELKKIDPEKEADKLVNTKLEAAKAQLVQKHTQELEGEREKAAKYRSKIETLLRDQVATAHIAEHKGSIKLLLPHVRANTRVVEEGDDFRVEVIDEEGNARIGDSKGAPMSIADLIKEMRESEEFGRAFDGEGQSGSGKQPGNGRGGNPTLKRSQMTPQQKHEFQQKHGQAAFLKLPK